MEGMYRSEEGERGARRQGLVLDQTVWEHSRGHGRFAHHICILFYAEPRVDAPFDDLETTLPPRF